MSIEENSLRGCLNPPRVVGRGRVRVAMRGRVLRSQDFLMVFAPCAVDVGPSQGLIQKFVQTNSVLIQLLSEGISINAALIFDVREYLSDDFNRGIRQIEGSR